VTATTTPPTPPGRSGGRAHHPAIALILALLIPGAGQAYNGQPIKGFFLLFFSVLILPLLYSLYDAYAGARKIVTTGGRWGRGGFVWVFLQAWLAVNVGLMTLIVLTIAGVLT
jgi:hypothetical protein